MLVIIDTDPYIEPCRGHFFSKSGKSSGSSAINIPVLDFSAAELPKWVLGIGKDKEHPG